MTVELDELGGPGGPYMLDVPAGLEDMFGQFFEDGLVVGLLEEPLEELLEDDELDLVEELTASLKGETV